jgi:cytoskeletal protein RodZ
MMNETLGTKLRHARELRHLTLQQVSETTKVRPHYLQALENDDHSAIPSTAQARGFLRIYADFLELNLAEIMPVAPPTVPTLIPQSTSTTEKVPPPPETPQTNNILTRLRRRFTRRSDAGATPVEAAKVIPPTEEASSIPANGNASESTQPSTADKNNPKTVKKKRKASG